MLNDKVFHALYENSPLGIILCTVSGCLMGGNRSAAEILEFSQKELEGLRLDFIIHPDDWDDFLLSTHRIKNGEIFSARLDKRYKKNKGEYLWVDLTISIIPWNEGASDLLVLMFQVITDRNANEVQVSRERTWKQAQSIAKLGIWKMQIDTRLLEWSDETYRIFGINRDDKLFYSDFLQLTHPDDRDLVDRSWQSAIRDNSVYDLVHRIVSMGEVKWVREQCEFEVDSKGKPIRAVGVVKDVTEQILAKQHLEIKNKELQQIRDALDQSSLVTIVDKKGTILKVNKRLCEVSKYEEEELIGKNQNFLSSGYHSKQFWKDFWATIKQGKVWHGEIKNRAKDGSTYWVNTTINPICNEKGEIIHYLTIRQDITSRKIYEELLLQANLRLAQIEQFINFTTDAMLVSDPEGKFIYLNAVASQRLGIPREECHQFNITDIEPVFKEKTDWYKRVEELIKVGSMSLEGKTFNQSTGVAFPVEVTMRYISIYERDYIIVVSRDITERKKNEMVLRKSQARLAEAQRMAKLGYWELDLLTNMVWWSDEQYKINGVVKSDVALTQSKFIDLLHPDDRQWVLETMHTAISTRSETSITYRIIRPDGEERVILGYSSVINNENGQVVKLSGVNQDVTDRILTERALRESEATLRKAQEVAKIGSWKIDVNSDMLQWSEECYRIFDAPPDKALTYEHFLSYVHPEDKEFVDKSWKDALNGATYDIVHRIIVNKKIKWVREQAALIFDDYKRLIYGFGIVQDITDHKVLQDSNLIFNQSLLLTGLGSWRATFKNNDLFLSDNVYNLHGLVKDNSEITFKNYLKLIHPEDQERFKSIIAKVFVERGSFETEYRVEIAPGEIHWLFAKGKVLADHLGNPMEMYGIVRDITAEKINTIELIKARKEAEEASYVKDQFLSVMSHEIRTPLNSVIGLSNLILKRNPREDQLEIMKILKGSADNLLHLVNDILDFNKIRAGKLELEFIPFRLSKFLQHLQASFKLSALDKGIDFSIQTDTRIPDVLIGDVTRLNQIFNNLLGNAIKFTSAGYVKFKVDLKARTEKECTLIFNIEDSGIGITPDKIGTIFQPFRQSETDTSRKYGGTGLGLSIAESLVQILNGDIQVTSIPAKGSVFSVKLDFILSTDVTLNHDPPENVLLEPFPASVKKSLKILYVEDVESNRFLIGNLLSDFNIETIPVASGKVALQFTKLNKFDLILMDIQMPEMDGYETTRKIRNQAKGMNKLTPVLAFTAEPYSEELRKKVTMHGIEDVITKPFDADLLIDKIKQCTEQQTSSAKIFSFAFYEEAFNRDTSKLKEIKKLVIKDILRFKKKLVFNENRENWEGMRDEIHRILPIFKKLECDQLILVLNKYKEYDRCGTDTKEVTSAVTAYINEVLTRLSKLDY